MWTRLLLAVVAVTMLRPGYTQVSSSDRQLIIELHNKFRSQVNPTATNMMKMYWSEDIAHGAQDFIDTCPKGHDSGKSREEGAGLGIFIGQNMGWGYGSWESVIIKGWHGEVKDFRFGHGSVNGGAVGHYTQVVRDHATHIGCGYKNCGGSTPTYACNYAYAQYDWTNPYKSGPTCADCPNFCRNNMCDCGDVVCRNGGNMDPNTCKCRCASPWAGKECAQLNCPESDPSTCGLPGGFQPEDCEIYSNVPGACPYMCGICG